MLPYISEKKKKHEPDTKCTTISESFSLLTVNEQHINLGENAAMRNLTNTVTRDCLNKAECPLCQGVVYTYYACHLIHVYVISINRSESGKLYTWPQTTVNKKSKPVFVSK